MKKIGCILLFICAFIPQLFAQTPLETKLVKANLYPDYGNLVFVSEVKLNEGDNVFIIKDLSPYYRNNSFELKEVVEDVNLIYTKKINGEGQKVDWKKSDLYTSLNHKKERLTEAYKELNLAYDAVLFQYDMFRHKANDEYKADLLTKKEFFEGYKNLITEKAALETKMQSFKDSLLTIQQYFQVIEKTDAENYDALIVGIYSDKEQTKKLRFTYDIVNTYWKPSYNLYVDSESKKIKLKLEANFIQNTAIDWNNIPVEFFSKNETTFNSISKPFKINLDGKKITYEVKGIVLDKDTGEPLASVVVNEVNTKNGTVTDMEGYFSLNVKDPKHELEFSFIGYNKEKRKVSSAFMSVLLAADEEMMEEVVVTGYSRAYDDDDVIPNALQGRVEGIMIEQEAPLIQLKTEEKGLENLNTSFDVKGAFFETKKVIQKTHLASYDFETELEYYAVLSSDEYPFVVVKPKNWEKAALISAKVNMFLDGEKLGESYLRANQDTMQLSMGQDEKVRISNKKVLKKNDGDRNLFSKDRIIEREYSYQIHNRKDKDITLVLEEAVPVSEKEEFRVFDLNIGDGTFDKKTGIVRWVLKLKAGESNTLTYGFKVKVPNNATIDID